MRTSACCCHAHDIKLLRVDRAPKCELGWKTSRRHSGCFLQFQDNTIVICSKCSTRFQEEGKSSDASRILLGQNIKSPIFALYISPFLTLR